MRKPEDGTYPDYYKPYIDRIEGEDTISNLEKSLSTTTELFKNISEEKGNYRYAEGKWTVKELFGHIIDTERVMAYRALCIARGEQTSLPGFEQDDYVENGKFSARSLGSLLEEYIHLRKSNIALFRSFDEEQASRSGTANDRPITACALIALIAGHELHHIRILKERYLL